MNNYFIGQSPSISSIARLSSTQTSIIGLIGGIVLGGIAMLGAIAVLLILGVIMTIYCAYKRKKGKLQKGEVFIT